MPTLTTLRRLISSLSRAKVLVIGDLIFDEFLWGGVKRISPEAPVPVVWVERESFMPGGAANVASNVRALGGQAFLSGIIGDDDKGALLRRTLNEQGVDTRAVLNDASRPTTVKTRVIAQHQQVVRIDKECVHPVGLALRRRVMRRIGELIDTVDGIILEDYGKGVVTAKVIKEVVSYARKKKKCVVVDPKVDHLNYYAGVTAITPNQKEASWASGIEIVDERTLMKAGRKLLQKIKSQAVLLTMGEAGMYVFERGKTPVHIPTVARDVYDVSGAGDTVIATFTLALARGASMTNAAHLANYAAGIVVEKVGVATVTPDELLERIQV